MNYGERLKEIRLSNNISQNKMALILGIKRSTYGHYEAQYEIIPINHLINFCEYFNISVDYIFNLSNNNKKLNFNIDKIIIGERLKKFRKDNKLTQSDIAKILNTTKTVICGYEKGRYMIATPFLYTICYKYNISADYMLGFTDNKEILK